MTCGGIGRGWKCECGITFWEGDFGGGVERFPTLRIAVWVGFSGSASVPDKGPSGPLSCVRRSYLRLEKSQ